MKFIKKKEQFNVIKTLINAGMLRLQ